MTRKPARRILTFPAVRPCDGVSAAALLQALVAICLSIADDHPRKFFPAHRRCAREAIREVGIILLFLEEIADRPSRLSDCVVLCFSELYFALQKMRFLLEDCSREGARIWILMQLELVTHKFRILIRSIGNALAVLPLESINVPEEIRELIDLVAKQAQKVNIETDPGDELAANKVLAIFNALKNKIVPDPDDLKLVLDRLEIRSWSECNKEIGFLEEEIELERSKGEKENDLLCSLLGLMNYSRSVVFEDLDIHYNERSDCRYDAAEVVSSLNPEDFKCPITLELMKDPVIIATGQTYDRESIVKWFKAGHLICPKTGEKLSNTELIPNSALHKLIQDFCHENGIVIAESTSSRSRDLGKTLSVGSQAAATAMTMLATFLTKKLSIGTKEEKNKAAYEIRLLAKSNIFNRACLVEAGAVPLLTNLLSSSDPQTQENATASLLSLSKYSKAKALIFESGGLGLIVNVLVKGLKIESRQNAAAVLFYLSSVDEYCQAIGEMPQAIPALVDLLQSGTDRGKKNAAVAIFGLLQFSGNHQRVLSAGTIPLLMNLLSSERSELVIDSLAVLAALAEKPEGTFAIVQGSAIPTLVEFLRFSASRTAKEHCVSILLSLSINGGAEVVQILQKTQSLIGSLFSLITDGSSRAGKKARLLLNLLHGRRNSGPSVMLNSMVRREHPVVHVQ